VNLIPIEHSDMPQSLPSRWIIWTRIPARH